ncbi:hypothetical protein ACQUD0_04575 [Vagococcus fluvialis]|uniref:hypothetical protein n=1 Tax=Vagococcus fluvialis TaxID=2738 RepID=UPI003D0F3561
MFEDLYTIKKYFRLSNSIKRLEESKEEVRTWFYSQNLATHTEYSELGIYSKGFRQDIEVLDLMEALEHVDKRIERARLRQKYFNRYLNELPIKDRYQLIQKVRSEHQFDLSEKIYYETLEEIQEIEMMICLREGLEYEEVIPYVEIGKTFEDNLDILCDAFAI